MSDDVVTVRLRRDWAQFLQRNLSLMLERTRDAITTRGLPEERREPLCRRALVLAKLDDAVRNALLDETPPAKLRPQPAIGRPGTKRAGAALTLITEPPAEAPALAA
jgi:hypothetical protein